MTQATIQAILGWSLLFNIAVLMLWFLTIAFASSFVYKKHSQWFKLSEEHFFAINYSLIGAFKLLVFMFFVIPYLVMRFFL